MQQEQEPCITMCSEEHIWSGVQVVCRLSRSTHLSFQDARLQVLGVIFATCSKARIQTKLLQTPRPAFVVVQILFHPASHAVKTVRLLYLPSAPARCSCAWHPFVASLNVSKYKSLIANSDLGCFNKQSCCFMGMGSSHPAGQCLSSLRKLFLCLSHILSDPCQKPIYPSSFG